MKKVNKTESKINTKARVASYRELVEGEYDVNSRLLLIQQLIPIGLLAVEEALQSEVTELAGQRYSRDCSLKRWGSNPGSVFLGNQKLSILVPRLRDTEENEEVGLEAYRQLQSPQIVDERVFAQVLNGISTRKYEKAVEKIPETLNSIRKELSLINQSAVNSLDEGFEETITLHRLGVFKQLGISLKTTNCIESLNRKGVRLLII